LQREVRGVPVVAHVVSRWIVLRDHHREKAEDVMESRAHCNGRLVAAFVAIVVLAVVTAGAQEVTLPKNNPIGPREPEYIQGVMVDSDFYGNPVCGGSGWELVQQFDNVHSLRRLEGEVVTGHVPHGDLVFNHHTEDANFFVYPDNHNASASYPGEDYRSLLGSGNFGTGQPKEHGLIEVEWEYGAHSWNNAAGGNYFGFPSWAWPALGDRVLVEGMWTFDCGHDEPAGYRTEIHPPRLVVTYRNTMTSQVARGFNRKGTLFTFGPDDRDFSPVTRADVFASSFGGKAVDDIFDDDVFLGPQPWWQPVNDRDYDFVILAPTPKPSPDAVLVWRVLEPPSDYQRPPGAVEPTYIITPITRPLIQREGVHVHIPFSQVSNADYMIFAKTIIVGWDVPHPDARIFRITVNRWNIFDDLEPETEETEYSAWATANGQHIFVRLSDGGEEDEAGLFECDSDENYAPYCDVDSNENSYAQGTMDVVMRSDQPLVVQFRAKETDLPINENDEAGFAEQSFTEAENWGIGTHYLQQDDHTFAGVYHDAFSTLAPFGQGSVFFFDELDPCIDTGPNDEDACFEVTYTIERIMDDTELTIGVPPVQYAMDPNRFTVRVVTPGSPEKPRRRLPVVLSLNQLEQELTGVTNDNGVAQPNGIVTLPAGVYPVGGSFFGNGVLEPSFASLEATIERDFTGTSLEAPEELRWGHADAMTVRLMEPNIGQLELPLPIPGKPVTVRLSGPLGAETYPAGPTGADGRVVLAPLMLLPPGNYEATACFEEDPWFRSSCSPPQPVKVTVGFGAFARGGPITFTGSTHTGLGDIHSESSFALAGVTHTLSAASGERLQYVTTFTDSSTGSQYNQFQVPAFGQAPAYVQSTYCSGAASLMGVPITYITGNHTFPNDAVLSGIYCVSGDIKLHKGVTGAAVLVAGGEISTSGDGQNLTTADPTGADVLLFAWSDDDKAASVGAGSYAGTIVARGGVEVGAMGTVVTSALVGRTVVVKGLLNAVDGR
jgi:hypothetical protein